MNFVLLEAAAGTTTQPGGNALSGLESSLPLILIMVIMIAFIWFSGRKQRKRQKMMQERKIDLGDFAEKAAELAEQGKTPLFFAEGEKLLGILGLADPLKPTGKKERP